MPLFRTHMGGDRCVKWCRHTEFFTFNRYGAIDMVYFALRSKISYLKLVKIAYQSIPRSVSQLASRKLVTRTLHSGPRSSQPVTRTPRPATCTSQPVFRNNSLFRFKALRLSPAPCALHHHYSYLKASTGLALAALMA